MSFPVDFVWGAASSAFQIEGAAAGDGKGLSVWDMMCRKPNTIWDNQNGDIACNHYNLYKTDVKIMRQIGLKAYRMSISWPRVLPMGVGKVNENGLVFYDRLVDELLENGIEPYITLFHWDFPYELYCQGGWLNAKSSSWFAEYSKIVVERLSDRVKNWMTINEPQCFIGAGHLDGQQAPGDELGWHEVLKAGHNALLAHGKAVQVIRAYGKQVCNVGYSPVGVVKIPYTMQLADIAAARESMFKISKKDCWNNTWWTDPVFLGKYPDDGLEVFKDCVPAFTESEMKIISEPVDFCGANIYNGREIQAGAKGAQEAARPSGFNTNVLSWSIVPESLYWGPKFLYERYKKPVIITENGLCNLDWVSLDGRVHDPQRIDFMQRYLIELHKAISEGIEIKGYFHWSLTDNFEWTHGTRIRFGLVYVDYPTQKRILKDSAYWYKEVIAANGDNLDKQLIHEKKRCSSGLTIRDVPQPNQTLRS